MPYRIQYSSSAKEEVNFLLETYGSEFRESFYDWLRVLADEAERRTWASSIDAIELLETILSNGDSPWKDLVSKTTWDRFRELSFVDKVRALITMARKRCPPWQFRAANNWLLALSSIELELSIYYLIDHVEQRLIVYVVDCEKS